MANKTSICNKALSYLGANFIIEMTDKTPEAKLCSANYDDIRDAVLEDVNWSFATKRYSFKSPLSDPPVFGYANAFKMPTDVLRIIAVSQLGASGMLGRSPATLDWAYEDRNILTDAGEINVLAVIRVDDPSKYSPGFIEMFASRLAAEIALPLTNSVSQYERMVQMYMAKKRWAQSNDGRQGKSQVRTISEIIR